MAAVYRSQHPLYNTTMQPNHNTKQLTKLLQQANAAIHHALSHPPPPVIAPLTSPHPPNSISQSASHKDEKQQQSLQKSMQQLSIFDRLPSDIYLEEGIEQKISGLKLTQFTSRRKDDLFKRYKKDQEEKLASRKKEIQKSYYQPSANHKLTRGDFTLKNEKLGKVETLPITGEDMEKLRPETDLNDTIVGNYIKILQFAFLPSSLDNSCYIYSSFFLQKIVGDMTREEVVFERDATWLSRQVQERVTRNYKDVKRWTRRIDIFEKEILVFPINAFRHWYCIFVLKPSQLLKNPKECKMLYCDSMCQKREFVVEAIRMYLVSELSEKKSVQLSIPHNDIPCYQLLLPRQTNTHDCGLYMLCYVEELLMNTKHLEEPQLIPNRRKLRLFPRTLAYSMRDRLRKLFSKLINAKDQGEKSEALAEYQGEKKRIMEEADSADYDVINEKEYRKYEKMNLHQIQVGSSAERAFSCELRFYLDPEINFYEKDK